MNFLESIFARLKQAAEQPILQEVREGRLVSANGKELLTLIRAARAFFADAGLKKGDRCALLAPNSIQWAALDLALMSEGILVVPLYTRQAAGELVAMMKDCAPSLLICADQRLRDAVAQAWSESPKTVLAEDVFSATLGQTDKAIRDNPAPLATTDPVTIIYTSGTSGEAKGVILNIGNLNHMLGCTGARLDLLMGPRQEPEQVFHYLPFCFAGSWILLLSCLSRSSRLALSTDLSKLVDELKIAAPHYFLNVPVLLERVRTGILDQLDQRGGVARLLFRKGEAAWRRKRAGGTGLLDPLWLSLAQTRVFPVIREKIGPNLKAIICGSAPLAKETQLFFVMLGLPVLQVYGLTETTAICTMDHPHHVEPGRVGPAIPGIEMKLGENDEILVRGPNIFPGYWNRPAETAAVIRDGWFHTGDQGEVDGSGNWAISGRIKNLIVLSSGHNVAPEPVEDRLAREIAGAQQVVLVGNGCSHLAALVTGKVAAQAVEAALERINAQLPHYKRIRGYHVLPSPFTPEEGLLTANGKLKREAIAARFQGEIEALYHEVRDQAVHK